MNDYGIKDNKLHVEALAQTSTGMGSGVTGTGSSSTRIKYCREVNCSAIWVGTADLDGCINIYNIGFVDMVYMIFAVWSE